MDFLIVLMFAPLEDNQKGTFLLKQAPWAFFVIGAIEDVIITAIIIKFTYEESSVTSPDNNNSENLPLFQASYRLHGTLL